MRLCLGLDDKQVKKITAQNIRPNIKKKVLGLPLLCQRLIITLMVDQMRK